MLGLIWAQARGGVIGRDGEMPWHLPEDLAHFRAVTRGHPVIMGRRTWESIPERFRPLPGRRNIVVTRDADWSAPGAEVAHSLEQAIRAAQADSDGEVWVMGGGQVYAAAMPLADRLEVTEIDLDVDGDTTAPAIGPEWIAHPPAGDLVTSATGIRYRFVTFHRA